MNTPAADDPTPLPDRVRPFTALDPEALANLARLRAAVLAAGVPGDLVECGVCNGGSAAVLGAGLADPGRRLWLYDSFTGMPPAGPEDPPAAHALTGAFKGSPAAVRRAFAAAGVPWDRVVVRQGLFADTLAQPRPDRIALLHVDADWYASVYDALSALYPLVSEGGAVVLDDFGWWAGARKAFYAFCEHHRVRPLLERCGPGQAWWVKGVESHRRTAP